MLDDERAEANMDDKTDDSQAIRAMVRFLHVRTTVQIFSAFRIIHQDDGFHDLEQLRGRLKPIVRVGG